MTRNALVTAHGSDFDTDKLMTPRSTAEDLRAAQNLVRLRRVVLPMREVLNTLLRRDDLVGCSPAMQPFLQDVYDHVLRHGMDGIAP